MHRGRPSQGFTVVEVIIIIVLIGLLGTIAYFTVGDWRVRSANDEVRNQLHATATELENVRNFGTGYPADLDDIEHVASPNVTLDYTRRGDGSYCLKGTSTVRSSVTWYVDSRNGDTPAEGICT